MKTKTQTVNIRPVLITVLALTCAISSIAWLNPEIKNGKIVIKNAPAIKKIAAAISTPTVEALATPVHKPKNKISFNYVTDTSKRTNLNDTTPKKKYKIILEDENGIKKEYNSVSDLPTDLLKEHANELRRGLDSIQIASFTYKNADWSKQIAAAQKLGEEMAKKVNTPEFRKLQKEIVAKSLAMTKQFNSTEWKNQQKIIVDQSMEMAKKASSPEMMKLVEEISKHAGDGDKYYNSDEFKTQLKKMTEYYDSPAFKKQANDMAKYYDSPAFKKQIKDMTKYYESPAFKKQMKDMAKYYDSPDFQKQMEDLGKSFGDVGKGFDNADSTTTKKIRDDVKREIDVARKNAERAAKERPEKKEAPERKEKPEKKEKPERKETTDTTRTQKQTPPMLAMVAGSKEYLNYGFSNSNTDTVPKKHIPTAVKKANVKVEEIKIDEPIAAKKPVAKKSGKVAEIVIDQPKSAAKMSETQVGEVRIDKSKPAKVSGTKVAEIRIDEPVPAKKPAAKKATTKLKEVVIEEPVPAKKP